MAILIKTVLDTMLSSSGDWRLNLLANWSNIIGSLHTRVRLEKIDGDILILGVYESVWLQELFMLSSVLIKTINQKLGDNYVKKLRFKSVVSQHKKKYLKSNKNIKARLNIRLSLNKHEEQALSAIKDEDLQISLKNFLLRCSE